MINHFPPAIVLRYLVLTAILTAGTIQPFVLPVRAFVLNHQSQNQDELQMFTGTIVSMNSGTFFLKSDTNGTMYGLDNQPLAGSFVGKKVSVTGTLDKKSTIHIKSIEEQKA